MVLLVGCQPSNKKVRQDISLDSSWQTAENDSDQFAFNGFKGVAVVEEFIRKYSTEYYLSKALDYKSQIHKMRVST